MKKVLVGIFLTVFLIIYKNTSYALAIDFDPENPYWNSKDLKKGYEYIGRYEDTNLPNIIEGVMFYKQKTIYHFQIEPITNGSYKGDVYPVKSEKGEITINVAEFNTKYIVPPTTYGVELSLDDANTGLGIKTTISKTLSTVKMDSIKYNISSGNVLDISVMPGTYINSNNLTLAVYEKRMKMTVKITKLRQTGPIWNVYWTINSQRTEDTYYHLGYDFTPVTVETREHEKVKNGAFFISKLEEEIRGRYRAE